MAHHQAMSLLTVCNLLFDRPFQQFFHAEPHVMATELLLHERMPAALLIEEKDPVGYPKQAPLAAAS
jgi:cyclic beta-1,2-glucan synthetase